MVHCQRMMRRSRFRLDWWEAMDVAGPSRDSLNTLVGQMKAQGWHVAGPGCVRDEISERRCDRCGRTFRTLHRGLRCCDDDCRRQHAAMVETGAGE